MANDMMNRQNNDMFDVMNDWFDLPKNFFNDTDFVIMMKSDVVENDKDYIVKIDMPGMKKDKIKINYSDGILSVSGSRESLKNLDKKDDSVIHQERQEGHISRSFRLPNIVANKIHAKYDDGVLTITLPKQTADSSDSSIQID